MEKFYEPNLIGKGDTKIIQLGLDTYKEIMYKLDIVDLINFCMTQKIPLYDDINFWRGYLNKDNILYDDSNTVKDLKLKYLKNSNNIMDEFMAYMIENDYYNKLKNSELLEREEYGEESYSYRFIYPDQMEEMLRIFFDNFTSDYTNLEIKGDVDHFSNSGVVDIYLYMTRFEDEQTVQDFYNNINHEYGSYNVIQERLFSNKNYSDQELSLTIFLENLNLQLDNNKGIDYVKYFELFSKYSDYSKEDLLQYMIDYSEINNITLKIFSNIEEFELIDLEYYDNDWDVVIVNFEPLTILGTGYCGDWWYEW